MPSTKRKKTKEPKPKSFAVPFEITMRGDVFVEAESAEEARAMCDRGEHDDETFVDRAETTNWETLGDAKEC